MTKKLILGNINLIINSSDYNYIEDYEYNSINKLFATNNKGFGGYSFAHAQEYCKQFDVPVKTYNFEEVRKRDLERSYRIDSNNKPKLFLSEITKNDFEATKKLMDQIIRFCIRNEYRNVRFFQLIHLNSKDNCQTFEGIKAAIVERKFDRPLTLVFDIDKNSFEEFCTHFNDYPYKNALHERFDILTYLFYNQLDTKKYKTYLKNLIDKLYSEKDYEEVHESCFQLLSETRDNLKEKHKLFYKTALLDEYNFYQDINDLKTKEIYKKFVFDSIELFLYFGRIFNKMDLLQIAYIFREFEYDTYAEGILNNLNYFDSIPKIEQYIIKKFFLKKSELESLSIWGFANALEFDLLQSKDNDKQIYTIKRKKSKKVRNIDKIKWGSEKIFKKINTFKKKYALFLKT
jgi:hypothetical protein